MHTFHGTGVLARCLGSAQSTVCVLKKYLRCHPHAPASAHAHADRGNDPAERLLCQLHPQQERLLGVNAVQEN